MTFDTDVVDTALNLLGNRLRTRYLIARHWHYTSKGRQPIATDPSQQYPEWDGGQDRWEREHPPVWPRLLAHVIKHQLPPEVLIETAMKARTGRRAPPSPTDLMDLEIVDTVKPAITRHAKELAAMLFSDQQRCETCYWYYKDLWGADDTQARRVAIITSESDYSNLFRYCTARRYGFDDLAERYAAAALAEYVTCQETCDQIYQELIPEELREMATKIRTEFETMPESELEAMTKDINE